MCTLLGISPQCNFVGMRVICVMLLRKPQSAKWQVKFMSMFILNLLIFYRSVFA